MVLSEVSLIVLIGVVMGLPVAWAMARLLSHQLYELSPHDPVTMVGSSLVILAVTALAGYWPARRASRIDPMIALRYE